MEFNSSPRNTLGVEVEIGLVAKDSLDLACRSNEVLDVLEAPFDGEHPKVKHEFYQSSIEVITGICETVAEAGQDLGASFAEVDEVLEPMGLVLQSGGLHPLADWEDLEVTDKPRYLNFAERIQWPARRSMCHGIHYHVGVQSADASVAIANSLAVQMPLFIALSASSPFWHGSPTGLASSRTKVFEAMPTNDLPPKLSGWDEFVTLMDVLVKGGAIESVRELWWDVRPHPGFGTVELRMSDAMGTMREVLALAALAQCLVYDLSRRFETGEELPWLLPWILKQNKWRAARFGIDTDIIVDNEGGNRSLGEMTVELVAQLAPTAEILGCTKELQDVLLILHHGNGASRQLAEYERSGDLNTVVEQLIREWQTNEPTGWE